MIKILLCFGTRPEAIKLAPVILKLREQKVPFEVCVSGQHRAMLDQVLDFFEITPEYDLRLMSSNQTLNNFSGKMLLAFEDVLEKSQPDLVIVHGDTTTSTIAAFASFNWKIPVAHVEAGLRTFNPQSPFPEEINRQLTARIASFHFAPTIKAKENLIRENIEENKIYITGNTAVDAVFEGRRRIRHVDNWVLKSECGPEKVNLNNYILLTGHRRENFGIGFREVFEAMIDLVDQNPDLHIIFPVHLNPNVKAQVSELLTNVERIHLIGPVSYPIMLGLIENCKFIISDSGGIQEEAPAFGKTVLVTREHSERMEGVKDGFSILVGTNKEKIIYEATTLLNKPIRFQVGINPYGDGKAAERIVDVLKSFRPTGKK